MESGEQMVIVSETGSSEDPLMISLVSYLDINVSKVVYIMMIC